MHQVIYTKLYASSYIHQVICIKLYTHDYARDHEYYTTTGANGGLIFSDRRGQTCCTASFSRCVHLVEGASV